MKHPVESKINSSHIWFLLTAAYGLVKVNAKWKHESDEIKLEIGLQQSKNVPNLFFEREGRKSVLFVPKKLMT